MSEVKKSDEAETKSASCEFNSEEYIGISKDEILTANALPMDVFLKISETKLLLIGRQGSKSLDEMHVVDEKSDVKFFVRNEDYKKNVGQNLMIAGIAVNRADVTDRVKMVVISRTTNSVFKEIEKIGFNHESLEHAKNVSKSIQILVAAQSDLLGVLTILADVSGDLLKHSMAVSAVAVMIAKSMKWTVAGTLEKLALGGLLHDIGMKELPKEVIEKARHQMNTEQRQIYESHVFRGVEILSTMPSVHDDVIAIALEHHENAIGQGYPRRIRESKMNPLARVVALADCFCELTLANVDHPQPKTAAQAIAYIETTLGQPFSKPAFAGLKLALNQVTTSVIKRSAA